MQFGCELDPDTVLQVIRTACTAAPAKMQQAMNILESFIMLNGCSIPLIRIINIDDIGATIPLVHRHMAVMVLKRFIVKRWTGAKWSLPCIVPEEKKDIKDFLLSYMHEPECKVAEQLACIVSHIASAEWPAQWSDLFPSLLQTITQDEHHWVKSEQEEKDHTPTCTGSYSNSLNEGCHLDGGLKWVRALRSLMYIHETLQTLSQRVGSKNSQQYEIPLRTDNPHYG